MNDSEEKRTQCGGDHGQVRSASSLCCLFQEWNVSETTHKNFLGARACGVESSGGKEERCVDGWDGEQKREKEKQDTRKQRKSTRKERERDTHTHTQRERERERQEETAQIGVLDVLQGELVEGVGDVGEGEALAVDLAHFKVRENQLARDTLEARAVKGAPTCNLAPREREEEKRGCVCAKK